MGREYVAIGMATTTGGYTASAGGEVGARPLGVPGRKCVEVAFDGLEGDAVFVSLRDAPARLARPMRMRSIGAAAEHDHWQFFPTRRLPEAYDALWWIRDTTPTRSAGP